MGIGDGGAATLVRFACPGDREAEHEQQQAGGEQPQAGPQHNRADAAEH